MSKSNTPHGQMPALEFIQKQLMVDSGRTVTLICSRLNVDKETDTHIDMGDGRRIFIVLHGYKWYHGADMEPGKIISTIVHINPTLTKDCRAVNWGLNELQDRISGLYSDGHPGRFPWSYTMKYFGGLSPIWLEYERRRLCENAHRRVVSSMESALRYASQPPFMAD